MRYEVMPCFEYKVLSLIQDISFSNVPAWYGATREDLKMDILAPKVRQEAEPFPLIVWICGGGYWLAEMVYFAQRGYPIQK